MTEIAAWLAFQIGSFGAAKDWLILALVSLVGGLLGAAWADLKGKLKALEGRLDAKIEQDQKGYERLTRCEERLRTLEGHREVER